MRLVRELVITALTSVTGSRSSPASKFLLELGHKKRHASKESNLHGWRGVSLQATYSLANIFLTSCSYVEKFDLSIILKY
jgi:hypothetical protein